MATKDRDDFVVLQSDVHGDDERVRAVLSGWGVEEGMISRLLTERRHGGAPPTKPRAARPDETITLLHGGTPAHDYTSH